MLFGELVGLSFNCHSKDFSSSNLIYLENFVFPIIIHLNHLTHVLSFLIVYQYVIKDPRKYIFSYEMYF